MRRMWLTGAGMALAAGLTVAAQTPVPDDKGLTAVAGIKVGHFTLSERPTGCTIILTEAGAVGGVDVRGAAPGTRETDLLDPVNTVSVVHAVVLSGGSAFGLDAAGGVVKYLEEKGIGYDTRVAKVPIVPAAILFDLGIGDPKVRPTADCGYRAAQAATDGPVEQGDIGAGAGATVGKLGQGRSMKAGIGSASIAHPDGLVVAALVAVNAVGDVIDPATGKVIAGVRTPDGKGLADARVLMRSGALRQPPRAGENTTIGIVATNAKLTKAQVNKMAQMAHDGFARAINPVHTAGDGDVIFAVATGTFDGEVNTTTVGALAAEAMADAIVRAALTSKGLPNIPSASSLAAGQ
jgi:L-aminopeptidase/D-esterase-like protein